MSELRINLSFSTSVITDNSNDNDGQKESNDLSLVRMGYGFPAQELYA